MLMIITKQEVLDGMYYQLRDHHRFVPLLQSHNPFMNLSSTQPKTSDRSAAVNIVSRHSDRSRKT